MINSYYCQTVPLYYSLTYLCILYSGCSNPGTYLLLYRKSICFCCYWFLGTLRIPTPLKHTYQRGVMGIGYARSLDLGKCKYDSRRKPPFLKGRFGGNVNINCSSADSLWLNMRVRLYDDCAEVGSKVSKAVQRATPCCRSRTTKKPNDYMIMTIPTKEKSPYQKKGWG